MSLGQTMLVGIAGAVIAGLVARLLFNAAAGFLLAFAVTFGLVYLIRRHRGGSLTRPAPRGGTRF
jgi:ABC-type Fe3+-siderophore transport system permease subunit